VNKVMNNLWYDANQIQKSETAPRKISTILN